MFEENLEKIWMRILKELLSEYEERKIRAKQIWTRLALCCSAKHHKTTSLDSSLLKSYSFATFLQQGCGPRALHDTEDGRCCNDDLLIRVRGQKLQPFIKLIKVDMYIESGGLKGFE